MLSPGSAPTQRNASTLTEESPQNFVCAQCEEENEPGRLEHLARSWFGHNKDDTGMIKSLTEKLKQAEEQNSSHLQHISDLKETNRLFEAELQQFQVKSFREISKLSWTPLEDQVIDTVLNEIHSDLEHWCDSYCVKDFEPLLSLSQNEAEGIVILARSINYPALTVMDQIRWWSNRWWTDNGDDGNDPSRILKAILARQMYHDLLSNPFLLMDALEPRLEQKLGYESIGMGKEGAEECDGPGTERPSSGCCTVYDSLRSGKLLLPFGETFKLTRAVDMKRAAKLRCDILRTLIKSPETGSKFDELTFTSGVEGTCNSFLDQLCIKFADQAISGATANLIEDTLSKFARSKLFNIWKRAAHLFIQLHAQMANLMWIDTRRFLGIPFEVSYMSMHQCHPPGSEAESHVHLILKPAIFLSGNEDGTEYKLNRRVISKASVVVGEMLAMEDIPTNTDEKNGEEIKTDEETKSDEEM
jgi:hypothetical protein